MITNIQSLPHKEWHMQLLQWDNYPEEKKKILIHQNYFENYFESDCDVSIRELFYQYPLLSWAEQPSEWLMTLRFFHRLIQKAKKYEEIQKLQKIPSLEHDCDVLLSHIPIPIFMTYLKDSGEHFVYEHFFTFCQIVSDNPAIMRFNHRLLDYCLKNQDDAKYYPEKLKSCGFSKEYIEVLSELILLSRSSVAELGQYLVNNFKRYIRPVLKNAILQNYHKSEFSIDVAAIVYEKYKEELSTKPLPRYSFNNIYSAVIEQKIRSRRDDDFLNHQLKLLIQPKINFMELCFILRYYRPSNIHHVFLFLSELVQILPEDMKIQQRLIEPLQEYLTHSFIEHPHQFANNVRKDIFLPALIRIFQQHPVTVIAHYESDEEHPLNFDNMCEDFIITKDNECIPGKNTRTSLPSFDNAVRMWKSYIEEEKNIEETDILC